VGFGSAARQGFFDKILPKNIALSCINRDVGRTPVDIGFVKVKNRSKWAIPWLEDDPALTSPQLWVGRMRRDAADALRYGCDGLMGIHWRTRILAPAVLALRKQHGTNPYGTRTLQGLMTFLFRKVLSAENTPLLIKLK
jgi:hypothetical protein